MSTWIVVTRSGGFAGLVSRKRAELDDGTVQRLQQELDTLVPRPAPRPDGFVYEVQLGERTAVLAEPVQEGELAALVGELFQPGSGLP